MNLSNRDINKTEYKPVKSEWYYLIKWIAIITMVIDHLVRLDGIKSALGLDSTTSLIIGRIAFPLFCWELAQHYHFIKTEALRIKALKRLLILALISEPFYELCNWTKTNCLNVIFTLSFSWMLMILLDRAETKIKEWEKILYRLLSVIVIFVPCVMWLLYDYYWIGLITPILYYFSAKSKNPNRNDYISTIIFILLVSFWYWVRKDGVVVTYQWNQIWNGIITHILVFFVPILFIFARKGTTCGITMFMCKIARYKGVQLFSRWFYPLHLCIGWIINLILS